MGRRVAVQVELDSNHETAERMGFQHNKQAQPMSKKNIANRVAFYNLPTCRLYENSSQALKAYTRLRKMIDPFIWAKNNPSTGKFGYVNTKASYLRNYSGGKKYLTKPTNLDFSNNCAGWAPIHYCSNWSRSVTEALVCIDVDCHNSGTKRGALDYLEAMRQEHFPNLFYEPSNSGAHGYVAYDKRLRGGIIGASCVNDHLNSFLTFCKWFQDTHKFDIEDIEICGRPSILQWSDGKPVEVSFGHTARVPVEIAERPQDFLNMTVLNTGAFSHLGILARTGRNYFDMSSKEKTEAMVEMAVAEATEHKPKKPAPQFDKIDFEELKVCLTASRNGKWPMWVEEKAAKGLSEEDSMDGVCLELARWCLHVEFYDESNPVNKTIEHLKDYFQTKHNGFVTRINLGKDNDVRLHVERIVKWAANHLDPEGAEIFCRIRQNRRLKVYPRIIMIADLLRGGQAKPCDQPSSCSTLCVPNFSERLPEKIEAIIARHIENHNALAKQDKTLTPMRTYKGEYPLVKFARTFLGHLWSKKGAARLSKDHITKIAGNKDNGSQYKGRLETMGLVDKTKFCPGQASIMYSLTRPARQMFEEDFIASQKNKRQA